MKTKTLILIALIPTVLIAKGNAETKIFPPSSKLTDFSSVGHDFFTIQNHAGSLASTDPTQAVVHLTLGDQCSTVDIKNEKVLENWHLCVAK